MYVSGKHITNKVRSSERSERRSEPFVGRVRDRGGAEGIENSFSRLQTLEPKVLETRLILAIELRFAGDGHGWVTS